MSRAEIPTVKIRSGREVLAKHWEGEPRAMTYANRTQANTAQAKLGVAWKVIKSGRPWFVAKVTDDKVETIHPFVAYERVNKEDGSVSPCSIEQVRRGLKYVVHSLDLAIRQIDEWQEVGNNFFVYRRQRGGAK